MAGSTPTVRELRRRWKPHKERLGQLDKEHPTNVRFHRACSWLGRVEEIDGSDDLDFALLGQWIAFNALYARWDEKRREPRPDVNCWRTFLERMLAMDDEERIGAVLVEHKRLVMSIFENEYLSRFFWEEPGERRGRKSKKVKFDARTWYIEKKWALILEKLVERIYLLRCQLVHGAATYQSRLNRTALRHASTMLGHLLPAILLVWIDHGAEQDWGSMCYPPLRKAVGPRAR